jgi:serine/threonine-protein kinase
MGETARAGELDLAEGQKVGEYVVEHKIGQGGFGSVFSAKHPLIGKRAAVKVLSRKYSADPEVVSRFVAEARAVNQIRDRHIIDIFGFGELEDGRSYYVMEYLEGEPLDERLSDGTGMPLEDAVPILRSIARALDAAHAAGIAHRDLKPANIFLVHEPDGTVFPKLLDFGIAKLLGENASAMHRTGTGIPIGTPYYMSPEQCRGHAVDHRTDIYSFGCVAYELLTGKLPFPGEHHLEVLMKQTTEEAPPPSSYVPELGTAVDEAIAWMMRKDPAERPATLTAAVAALEEAAGIEPEPVRRSTPRLPSHRTPPHGVAVAGRTPTPGLGRTPPHGVAVDRTPTPNRTPALDDTALAQSAAPATTSAPKRRPWGIVGAAALVVGGGVVAFLATRHHEPKPAPQPPQVVAPAPAPVVVPTPVIVQTPAPTPPPAPAPPPPPAPAPAPVHTVAKPRPKPRPVEKQPPAVVKQPAAPVPPVDPYTRE